MHDSNTEIFFKMKKPLEGASEEEVKTWEVLRAAAKKMFFARLCYGGSDVGIYRKTMAELPDLRMTQAEFSLAIANWMRAHPAYGRWYSKTANEVATARRVFSGMGRVRVLMGNDADVLRQALNHKIQSAGASVMNAAMRRVYDRYRQEKVDACFSFQIHDQLVVEAADEQLEKAKSILVEEMQRPFSFRGVMRSIPVELSVGKSLGDLE